MTKYERIVTAILGHMLLECEIDNKEFKEPVIGDWAFEASSLYTITRSEKVFKCHIIKITKTGTESGEYYGTTIEGKRQHWSNAFMTRFSDNMQETINKVLESYQPVEATKF